MFSSNAILSTLRTFVVTKVSGKMTSKAAFVERFLGLLFWQQNFGKVTSFRISGGIWLPDSGIHKPLS